MQRNPPPLAGTGLVNTCLHSRIFFFWGSVPFPNPGDRAPYVISYHMSYAMAMPGLMLCQDSPNNNAANLEPQGKKPHTHTDDWIEILGPSFQTGFPRNVIDWGKALGDHLKARLRSNLDIEVLFWCSICSGSEVLKWVVDTLEKVLNHGLRIQCTWVHALRP